MGVARDRARVRERLGLGSGLGDVVRWDVRWRLEKRHGGVEDFGGDVAAFKAAVEPYEVLEFDGNLLVTVGATAMWEGLEGALTTAFNNANARLGVGDSTTAEAVGQTDLQAATNKLRKAMNATYPTRSANQTTFQSDFGSTEANFTWNEVGTFNAASGGTMLNRKVQALGTKSSGSTWTLTETITLT